MTQTTMQTTPMQRTQPMASQPKETRPKAVNLQGGKFLALIVPNDEGEREAQAMENFFQACSSDEPFSLELVGTRREQGFVLRASSEEQFTFLSKQLEAQYPQAEIQRIAPSADPLILREDEHAVVGEFSLAQPSYLPLKTFIGKALAESGADPLAGLLASMEQVGPGQKIIAQLALVRAPERWLAPNIRKSVEHALQPERDKQMQTSKNATGSSDIDEGFRLLALLALFALAYFAYRWYMAAAWLPLYTAGGALLVGGLLFVYWKMTRPGTPVYDMKLVADKMARAGFYCQLRVIAIGKQATSTEEQLAAYIRASEVAYRQFTLASSNSLYLKRKRKVSTRDRIAGQLTSATYAFPYSHILLRLLHGGAYSWQVLNSLELSGMFHLPQEMTDLPLVLRISTKGLLASPEIAQKLKQTPAPLPPALIGYSKHRRFCVPVYLPFDALFTHKFFAGMSRSGKSVLIQLLAQAAMQSVREDRTDHTPQPGVFVIDPHRDLIMDILKLVPPKRSQDVLLLDMTDTEYPVGLNPLDATMGFTRDQAVQ